MKTPLFLRWVNIPEWWVNIKQNGGSTWNRIYTTQQKAVQDENMGATFQFSHSNYDVAGDNLMPDAVQMDTSKDKNQNHSIVTFTISDILNHPEGSYKIINGEIVHQ